ncbi:MAG TPA: DUF748 domain-containing protein [Steroidobacteraceae bacterium]|jgi:hypothetical protein|nr:DUF748 domain-containing protein [Steroidobacteraceae bacterium]
MRRSNKYLLILGSVVVLLVAARLALEPILLDYANKKLNALKAYDGHIDDLDLALLRGGYHIEGIEIVKTGAGQPVPFFKGDRIEATIEWRSLLRGSLVAEGDLYRPQVNLVEAESEQQSQLGKEVNWVEQFKQLFPFRFNTVRVHDGTVTFRAPGIQTKDALTARHIDGRLANLTNVADSHKETFAGFQFTANVLDGGSAKVDGSIDPLAVKPTFDLNLRVKNVQLPQVNPWLTRFIKADAESGEFELYTELAAADGKFKGYAKPVMRDVNIYSSSEPEKNPLKRLWEGIIDVAAKILENPQEDQVAARIPISGTIEHPDTNLLTTIGSVMHNAFVAAFARSLEGSISVRSVRQSLKGDDEKKEEKKEKKLEEKKRGPRATG